ncbi:hypothetical protein KP77_27340 [Jeotgalibacillus alimentarius]|uniref:DUF4440 domain-containing protein n=1 Tax=Jeotgalibacillus alimentarius TaxID=135826 RepID=A0A0C2VCE4_9BACL|nr:hypothetical protein [Jeotgalibacillus alimentarius]KIL46607.1 hypothetical protein KP77_27340 [Jeotgalibacillus alimentarius]
MNKLFKTTLAAGLLAVVLAGCSDEESTDTNANSADDGLTGEGQETHAPDSSTQSEEGIVFDEEGNVESAEVPAEAKEEIMAVFDQYIETFNNKDLEGYMDLLLFGEDYYNEEEEREALEEVFTQFDVQREVVEQTISGYEEGSAEVFSNMELTTTDPASGAEVTRSGRQVTIMKEVEGEWKIASIQFIAAP